MDVHDEVVTCHLCEVEFGIVAIISNGTAHQWIGSATCLKCGPEALAKAEANGILEETLETARKWLEVSPAGLPGTEVTGENQLE